MGFNWLEFLALARALLKFEGEGFSSEATKRTAVSRAYYAVFCFLRNYEKEKRGFKPTHSPKDHELLIKHLESIGKYKIANEIRCLRDHRNKCDYDDKIENLDWVVVSAFTRAKYILDYFGFVAGMGKNGF